MFLRIGFEGSSDFCLLGIIHAKESKTCGMSLGGNGSMGKNVLRS